MRTVGVEEELLLVDAHNQPAAVATRVLQTATASGDAGGEDGEDGEAGCPGAMVRELQEYQLEIHTSPQTAMSALEAELRA